MATGCALTDLSSSTSIALENPRNQTRWLCRTTTPRVRLWENMSQSNSGARGRGKVKRIGVLLTKSSRNVGSRWWNCLNSTCTPPIQKLRRNKHCTAWEKIEVFQAWVVQKTCVKWNGARLAKRWAPYSASILGSFCQLEEIRGSSCH
jgi:hypothetical protein